MWILVFFISGSHLVATWPDLFTYWYSTELLMNAEVLDFVCVFFPPNNASMLFLL